MDKLVCESIGKQYGKKQVLKGLNLTLEKGKIYGLIGRNGAGKTTLLSVLSAQNPPTEGTVKWNEVDIWENQEALNHICFSREISLGIRRNNSAVSGLKIRDYLEIAEHYYPYWDKNMAKNLIDKFGLNPKEKLMKLSKGMLSMVTIIVDMASKADFTFMDEPVAGLDVVMREYFYRLLLEEYSSTGRCFVVSTHIIEEASDIFEEVIIVKNGEILLKENTQELLARAYRIHGLTKVVDQVAEGLNVHNVEITGRGKSVTVLLKPGEGLPEGYDVTVQCLNLQNIFVALCGMGE